MSEKLCGMSGWIPSEQIRHQVALKSGCGRKRLSTDGSNRPGVRAVSEEDVGRGGGDRTHDLRLKRPLLYH